MGTISANKEIIKLYARQLKTPTFLNYDEIIVYSILIINRDAFEKLTSLL